jgi:HEAT repeat protein
MSTLTLVLVLAAALGGAALVAILAWFCYTAYLDWVQRRLEQRKGMYRELVADLASGERWVLDLELNRPEVLRDIDAFEAALEEQARRDTSRPAWLLEAYDRLGLIDKYVDRLRNAHRWRERALAAELLGRVGNAKAVPALLETVRATRTEDSDVRNIALRALARIADPGSVVPLTQALETADAWLAPHIADILTRHGGSAVESLLAMLERGAPPRSRAWAANVLGELRAESALPALISGLDDPDDEVRAKSATALGRLGDQSAVGPLLERLLADSAPFVRARIANALGQFGDVEVTDRLVHALGDPAWWVRVRSVEALERIGPSAEQTLLTALNHTDREIRGRAAVTLERLGSAAALATIVRDGDHADDAAETLVKFQTAGARELIAGLLMAPRHEARDTTLRAIRAAGRRDLAQEVVQVALSDPDPALRANAMDMLARFRVPEATTAALEAEQGDPEPAVRAAAIRALARQGGEPALRRVVANVASGDPIVRATAIEAATRLSLRGIHEILLERLADDPEPLVRQRAALATGLLRAVGGEAGLLAAAQRPEPPAVHAAVLLAIGAFDDESMVARLSEMPDPDEVQDTLRHLLRTDPCFRLLRRRLPPSRRPELRAVSTHTPEASEAALARGLDEVLEPTGRIRLIAGLKALQSDESREALLESARRDPSPEARTAALTALGELIEGDELLEFVRDSLADPSLLVRRTAVGLLSRVAPEKALPVVLRSLRPGDDPAIFTAVADLATPNFKTFADLALRMPDDATEALVLVRVARGVNHPDLPRLLPVLARSRSPEVRGAIAELWAQRPDVAEVASLAALTLDPAAGVRRIAARAVAAIRSWSLLEGLAADPDPSVRREVALAIGGVPDGATSMAPVLDTLAADIAMPVRAAVFAARLLQGMPLSPPPGIELREAAIALREHGDLAALRAAARTAPEENRRLAAALALALLQDQVAHEVARTDPFPSIRHRVGGALQLAAGPTDDAP